MGVPGSVWTSDEDAELSEMWAKGLTIRQIAEALGRSYSGVDQRRIRLRLHPRGREDLARRVWSSPEEAQEFIARVKDVMEKRGMTPLLLARETGMGHSHVWRLLRGEARPGEKTKKRLGEWLTKSS